jgi:hypothetical protein
MAPPPSGLPPFWRGGQAEGRGPGLLNSTDQVKIGSAVTFPSLLM